MYIDSHVLSTPALADIDADGHEELVVPVSYFFDRCALPSPLPKGHRTYTSLSQRSPQPPSPIPHPPFYPCPPPRTLRDYYEDPEHAKDLGDIDIGEYSQ